MTDKPLAVNVREALGIGSGITPKHEGPLRRPTEAIVERKFGDAAVSTVVPKRRVYIDARGKKHVEVDGVEISEG